MDNENIIICRLNNDKMINQNKQPSPSSSSNNAIIDRYNIVYIILLIHGIAMLMPWNMFINATEVCVSLIDFF
ncbi:hypothetical protein BLA29_015269 [Euroglyphus maynei]|uniref:Uncharacterized protein n=1 Tax=Euroglyphus maynei TaxID=6958 RepID=A0A1Y3BEN5_EURMA|nr:hypothetical protein BLA29_015269 [Euroglyphus maynei]